MKRKNVINVILGFTIIFFSKNALAASDIKALKARKNISNDKLWTINFNCPINKDTINNDNIIVTDSKGNKININVIMENEKNKVTIIPKFEGYTPANTYNIKIGQGVRSVSGKKLDRPVTMKFTTNNICLDRSNYDKLPKINKFNMKYEPILPNQNQTFYMESSKEDVQYRIYVSKYIYSLDKFIDFQEITNGYVNANNGAITTNKHFKTLNGGQKYKITVYVKRAGSTGKYKDENTDFDNYYIDYLRCVDTIDFSNVKELNKNKTLNSIVEKQFGSNISLTDEGPCGWVGASKNQIKYYLNPKNFTDPSGKYMFLKLSYLDDSITKNDLNGILKGKGILEGTGDAFIKAGKENNINPVYLISHALHETGKGTSKLACGIEIKCDDGNKKVYNMYGIKAFDSNPEKYGSEFAKEQKWFTPQDAIIGGAKFISERYVNSSSNPRDTLYEMKWNPYSPGSYQYATDIGWAYKQINNIKLLMDKCNKPTLEFKIPMYNK